MKTTKEAAMQGLVNDRGIREEYINKVEVLERVKQLLTIPSLNMATTKQVADFYGVGANNIYQLVKTYKEELEEDGYTVLSRKEFISKLPNSTDVESHRGYALAKFDGGFTMKLGAGTIALFPKRVILRLGMLMRDSEVAKEVRNQLLNIEEQATVEQKTAAITEEQTLQLKLGHAIASGDSAAAIAAMAELQAFKNRYIEQVETALAEKEAELIKVEVLF